MMWATAVLLARRRRRRFDQGCSAVVTATGRWSLVLRRRSVAASSLSGAAEPNLMLQVANRTALAVSVAVHVARASSPSPSPSPSPFPWPSPSPSPSPSASAGAAAVQSQRTVSRRQCCRVLRLVDERLAEGRHRLTAAQAGQQGQPERCAHMWVCIAPVPATADVGDDADGAQASAQRQLAVRRSRGQPIAAPPSLTSLRGQLSAWETNRL